ncbi:C2 domain-containing protein, partial [Auriculariales sp. MPI-PUGE-AT-0066]
MSRTPVEIGTLIVVILKARNLPNKKRIGKQDPYCTIRVNNETQRTKAINRGGQHPDWDEEFRFTLFGDIITSSGHEPQSHSIGMFNILGGTTMHLACFADSFREPDLIGDALVDFTVALAKGEWFQLSYKGQYVGEVYLEFTFWSNV